MASLGNIPTNRLCTEESDTTNNKISKTVSHRLVDINLLWRNGTGDTHISEKLFRNPFEHVIANRRMRILAGDGAILYGAEKDGVRFLIKILSFVLIVVNICDNTKEDGRAEQTVGGSEIDTEVFRIPCMAMSRTTPTGLYLTGSLCGVLVSERIKNVGVVFLLDLILGLLLLCSLRPMFLLLFCKSKRG